MSIRRVIPVAALVAALASRGPGVTQADVYRALSEQGIGFSTGALERAAVRGMLAELDPQGRLLGSGECAEGCTQSVERAEMLSDGLAYLKLRGLWEGGGSNIVGQLARWDGAGVQGAIVDLRGAGGRSLSAVDAVAGVFVPREPELYSVADATGRRIETHHAAGPAQSAALRMRVLLLVDGRTRDASELLAAVLKGRTGLLLVGAPTAGDPRVRRRIRLTGDETLFLAVGRAVPASGGDYEKVGVRPDIEVPESAAFRFEPPPDRTQSGGPLSGEAETNRRLTLRVGDDPVLGRAVDILLGLKALRSEGRGP